ncbi:MAG: hypothetical protein KDD82_28355 [Planctomycetes bacterium]|nr:hypothetical protein [Planctomycetota bacterium]
MGSPRFFPVTPTHVLRGEVQLSPHQRCPYCHDSLMGQGETLLRCADCATLYHPGCVPRGCATLGCANQGAHVTRRTRSPRPEPARQSLRWLYATQLSSAACFGAAYLLTRFVV